MFSVGSNVTYTWKRRASMGLPGVDASRKVFGIAKPPDVVISILKNGN